MKQLLLLLALFSHTVTAAQTSKIFQSVDAEYQARIIIAPAEKSGQFYINYRGFEHHYDNQTLLYKKLKNDLGNGFNYQLIGLPIVNVRSNKHQTLIYGTAVSFSEVFLDNDTVTRVTYVGNADVVQERRVKAQYQDRQLKVVSKVAAAKLIKQAKKQLENSCQTAISVNINWKEFKQQGLKTTPAKLAAYLEALEKVCRLDADYLEAVKGIKQIQVSISDNIEQHQVVLESETLLIAIGDQLANLPERSYQAIYDSF